MRKRCRQISSLVSPVGASTSSLSLRSLHLMSTLYQRCLACICRRSRCRASALTGTREACRVVSVGQNWRLDCNRSLHSAAELVPGKSIDTVSFCGWAPCHAEAALCEYTSCNIPSSRMGNFFVMSSSSMASQSTLAFATKIGWKPSALMFHFWIRQVTSRAREPLAASFLFFWLVAAWVKSRAERPSVSGVNRQLHVQIGCKLGIRNRKDELTKQAKRNKLQIKPEGN